MRLGVNFLKSQTLDSGAIEFCSVLLERLEDSGIAVRHLVNGTSADIVAGSIQMGVIHGVLSLRDVSM